MKRIGTSFIAGTLCCLALQASAQEAAPKPPYERLLKGDDAKQAQNLLRRTNELAAADDFIGAIRSAEELLALRKKVQGADHWEVANQHHAIVALQKVAALPAEQLAGWRQAIQESNKAQQLDAKGQHARAQPHWQEVRHWCELVLGEKHPHTAGSYNGLARNLKHQGNYAEAQPLYQKALDLRRELLGEKHPDTADSYNGLAFNYYEQGKYSLAQPLYQKAVDLNRELLGERHSDTATTYSNLAVNLNAQGKWAEAQPLHRKALALRREVLGEQHPNTAISYSNLAANLHAQGKTAEAQPLFQKALELSQELLGDEHPNTATSYSNLANNLDAQKKYTEAEPLYRKALDLYRESLGEKHPNTANSYNNLAVNLNDQGKLVEAQPLYQKALDLFCELLGEQHPATANSYFNLAANLDDQRKFADAQPFHQKALDLNQKLLGERHPSTANSYNSLAMNLCAQGEFTEAQVVLQKATFSFEASRLEGASGLERASLNTYSPRFLLAAIQAKREPEAAWTSIELSLARGLLDHQAAQKVTALTSTERADQTLWQNEVASLQSEILLLISKSQRSDAETTRMDELIAQRQKLEQRLAALAIHVSQQEVAPPATIRASLPSDAAFLFWVDVASGNDLSGDLQEHWGCVIRSSGTPKWEQLPGTGPEKHWTRTDAELLTEYREALAGNSVSSEIDSLQKQLYTQRFAPLTQHLAGVKTLYVVPFHHMAEIPLDALTTEYTISYVPSGTFLTRLKDLGKPTGETLFVLADPIFAGPDEKSTRPAALPPNGLLITLIAPGGPADQAGLNVGDVLLKYGDTELTDVYNLKDAISANASAKTIPVTVWREDADKPLVRDIVPGKLGIVVDKDPAPVAIANRRNTDAMLLALRGGDWSDLPGTRVEATRIGQLFGNSATVLADSSASEQKLDALRRAGELKKYRYLHFATHGEGNNVRAFESSLILAQDSLPKDPLPKAGEPFINGQLSASEVLEFWKLDAELVTLSACETAVGKQGGGDGPLGFAQAFLTAGARAVCLSLWKVDDTATTLLMDRFYQNLLGKRPGLDKPMGKAAALAEAKNWLRNLSSEEALQLTAEMTKGVVRGKGQKALPVTTLPQPDDPAAAKTFKPFDHPKYWAAFILIGDPD